MKNIQKIPLSQIDSSDDTFSVNFMADLLRLRSSIGAVGLIQPVLLRRKGEAYQIISGFRRISVFRELDHQEIEAMVFEEKECDESELFSIVLHENVMTRGFNTVEKAIVLHKLIDRFGLEPALVIRTFLPLLSLEPHEKILKTYLSLAGMEEELKRYVVNEEVSRHNIRLFSRYAPEDRPALIRFLSHLKLTDSRLREILTFGEEISRRERTPLREILNRPEFEEVLSEGGITPSQRADRFKNLMIRLRYPRRRQMEVEFDAQKRSLGLAPGISIDHSPHFEDHALRIQFQFETMEEYRAIVASLVEMADNKELQELVKVGHAGSKSEARAKRPFGTNSNFETSTNSQHPNNPNQRKSLKT